MDKTTNEVINYHSFPNQTITHSLPHQVGNKRKISDFSNGQAKLQQSSAHRSVLIEPQKVPTPDLGQRTTAACQVTSHFQSDHSTARATDQEAAHQSLSTGEFFFANTPLTQQRIIDQLRHEQPATYCIRALADLEKHGLMQQTWLEGGQLQKAEGRLFTDEPMTLVFDLTSMRPGDIASFNDLLQVGPKCNDKPLGDHIRRVFLVNHGMLDGSKPANPDLWRRLGQMPEKTVSEADCHIADSVTDETLLAQKTTEDIPANPLRTAINFATTDNWYHQLFGGITLNDRGRLVFSEGALANLKESTHLVFNNAPWEDTGFQTALATAIRVGGFTANRQWVRLPEQISLSVAHICATELNARKDQAISDSTVFCLQSPFVVINGSSIECLKGHVMVEGTVVVQTDMLANLLQGCRQLVLTGELDDKQWLWLLCQLEQLPASKRPRLFANLPTDRLLPARAPGVCNPHCDTFTYQINPGDTLESLQQVNLTSQNCFTFSLTNSRLLDALVNGTPTTLYGLERNPELAANLETLLLPAPYLFIHGHKMDLPKARVTFMPPPGRQTTGSALINALLNVSDSQPPAPENPVYSLLMSLPQSCQKRYPDRPPWTGEDFQLRFEQQAEAERLLDGSPGLLPCHQRRALHVLLAKAYRGDPEIYSFIKAKIAGYYPDQPADNRADRSALEQWLTDHPVPELRNIEACFWTLARHCPATVHQDIKNPHSICRDAVKQLAIYMVAAAPRAQQRPLAQRLGVDLRLARQKRFFDGNLRSTLKDTLIAHRLLLRQNTIISQTIGTLESQISAILNQADQQKSQQLRELLATNFVDDQLPGPCQDLPDALLARQRHHWSRQERRLVHLARRVREHPVVFLQGEAGAGKTFMARAIAAKAKYPGCQVLQLGPNHTQEALFGGPQLVSYSVGNGAEDHGTEFCEGPLLQWALSKDPPLLVLDEANLAPEGLLAPLAGLTRQPPVLQPLPGWPDDSVWRTNLGADELPGKCTLILNNQWQPLPALTPKDQLRALRCTPKTPVELARSELTGQLLIKSQASSASPVTVDFIIAPGQTYFTQLRPGEWLTLPEGLCSQRLEDLLAETIFYSETNTCKAYAELRNIHGIPDIPQRLRALLGWLDTFSDRKNVTGQDEQLLLNMLREKQGACRHKATIFQVLCHYWGIPARQVENASHRFVEISPDGGRTWRQYQLGGGGQTIEDIAEPDWGDYHRPGHSALKPPEEYAYSDQFIGSWRDFFHLIDKNFDCLANQLLLSKNESAVTAVMHTLEDIYSTFHRESVSSGNYRGMQNNWGVLLSPQMFYRLGKKINEWKSIIEKSAWLMVDTWGNEAIHCFMLSPIKVLYRLIDAQEPDVHYLNWLCDLYRSVPEFLKYVLLAILQTFSESCDSC